MKTIHVKAKKYFLAVVFLTLMFGSCKKDNTAPTGGASLTIVNTVVGSNPLITNFSDSYTLESYYTYAAQLYYGNYYNNNNEFGSYLGHATLMLYQYPDTTSKSTPLYKLNLDLTNGSIHTLFLTGLLASPDTLYTTDNPPYHPATDSSVGVRFVNLSPGSSPVNITLAGAAGNEFSAIGYKGITAFKNYPADASVSSYIFQFTDAETGTLLGTYLMDGISNGTGGNNDPNNYRFRNFTIALIGVPDGTGGDAQTTMLINNY